MILRYVNRATRGILQGSSLYVTFASLCSTSRESVCCLSSFDISRMYDVRRLNSRTINISSRLSEKL